MKLIRALVFPWFVFFAAAVAGLILLGVKFTHVYVKPDALKFAFVAGTALSLLANSRSLGNVGIWMSESLPESLRYSSWRWIFRAIKAAAVAFAFYFLGQFSWMPLIWPAFVVPTVFTICLFTIVFSLIGPVLKFSSNMAWSKAFSLILSVPVVALVPFTALFIGQNVVSAYRSSQPDALFVVTPPVETPPEKPGKKSAKKEAEKKALAATAVSGSGFGSGSVVGSVSGATSGTAKVEAPPVDPNDPAAKFKSPKISERAKGLREIAESSDCAERGKEIVAAMDPKGSDEVVYWAVKAVGCSDLRSAVGLPRLVQVMQENQHPVVRATAILAMKKFGNDNVRQIAYLLVKRLSEKEPPEVVEATAQVMSTLGGNDPAYASNRLKALLDSKPSSRVAALSLMRDYGRSDVVEQYVEKNLDGPDEAMRRAVNMICLLPKDKRQIADSHVNSVVGSIRSAEPEDPGVQALNCMGPVGLKAIRDEVNTPKRLERSIAARVLAEMNVKDSPEAIETADGCTHDENPQVRQWCSRSLGQMGAPALPKILALLESSDKDLKDAGKNALDHFDDPRAREELRKVKAENSGWMANNKKLQIAKAVGTALLKIETPPAPGASPTPVSAIR